MRGDLPIKAMVKTEKSISQRIVIRWFGRLIMRKYKYEPLFLLPLAEQIRAAVKVPLSYIGGATTFDDLEKVEAAGFDFVSLARGFLADSNLVNNLRKMGADYKSPCTHCNDCIAMMESAQGVHCPEILKSSPDGQIAQQQV